MKHKFTSLIEKISKDQESKVAIKIIGVILVVLSGMILFLDKVYPFEIDNRFGFKKTSTFLWVLSQTLSPILLILASAFKPYKTSYIVPVYIYTIQFIWVFQPNIRFDNYYLQTYALGACLGFIILLYVVYKVNLLKSKQQKENELFKKEALETIELLKNDIL